MLAPIISDPAFYAVAIPAVIFLGLAKGGFSGVATGATPLLALYLPPLEAAALLLPIVLCQDVISVHAYWREWSGWNLKILLPAPCLAWCSAICLQPMYRMTRFAFSSGLPPLFLLPRLG